VGVLSREAGRRLSTLTPPARRGVDRRVDGIIGEHSLDDILKQREQTMRQPPTVSPPAGIKVEMVEMKDVEIPQTMPRAMARGAEAPREARLHHQGSSVAGGCAVIAPKRQCPAGFGLFFFRNDPSRGTLA